MSYKDALETKECFKINPKEVIIKQDWNPRVDFTGEKDLIQSIIENGVIMPVTVKRNKQGKFELIDGERRLRAALKAMKEIGEEMKIPAFIEGSSFSNTNALCRALVTNDGKPLLHYEEAEAFVRLMNWGNTPAEIAKKIGRSSAYVLRRINFINATPETRKAVKSASVSFGKALTAIEESEGDESAQNKLVDSQKYHQYSKKSDTKESEPIIPKVEKVIKMLETGDDNIAKMAAILRDVLTKLKTV